MNRLQRLTATLAVADSKSGKALLAFTRMWDTLCLAIEASLPLDGSETMAAPIKLKSYTVANLPTVAAGAIAYASNGRKAGEGGGAGTGVMVFGDATNWRACDTGATVAA